MAPLHLPEMLTRLTLAVAAKAARACAAWRPAGYPGPVSVNIPIAAILAGFATEMMPAAEDGIPAGGHYDGADHARSFA